MALRSFSAITSRSYAYKGDLGMDVGVDFDLDIHNGRFCVTPEFPKGPTPILSQLRKMVLPPTPTILAVSITDNDWRKRLYHPGRGHQVF